MILDYAGVWSEAEGSTISHETKLSKSRDTSHPEWLSKIGQMNQPLEKGIQNAYRGYIIRAYDF